MQTAGTLFQLARAALQLDLWAEWVNSEANIADIPSRDGGRGHPDEAEFRNLGLHLVPLYKLSEETWDAPTLLYRQLLSVS